MKVTILGASGETGQSIVNGLLESGDTFEITALTRESSLDSPKSQSLRDAGVTVVAADLKGPEADLVKVLEGAEVVISTVNFLALRDQIPLANAAKKAGVKRFIPCTFATAAPPRGVMALAEIVRPDAPPRLPARGQVLLQLLTPAQKDEIFAHIKKLYLPYTVIDVGWWYQITLPSVPSGRLDAALINPVTEIFGGGDVRSALTDSRDIGRFVARIIQDPRTLNKLVFAYGTVLTQHQVWDAVEKASGETLKRTYISNEDLQGRVDAANKAFAASPDDLRLFYGVAGTEYNYSWGVRGDNTPENARYLGYLDARELYPDIEPITFESFVAEALEGRARRAYA